MKSRRDTAHGDGSPLVSVVIPTYKRSDHLAGAVESVAAQTYRNIELLVVDDGSPVPVSETLTGVPGEEFENFEFIRHSENRGANVARNTGIRESSGKYIAFLDDDDRWDERKVERQVQAFAASSSDVGVVYTGTRNDGERGTTTFVPSADENVVKDLLTGEAFGQFSSVMVQKTVISEAGMPDERFPAWQDREWFFRLAKHCHFEPLKEVLTYRHIGLENRITRDFEAKRDVAYPLFLDKHYSFARQVGLYHARSFLASLRMDLAWSAIQADRYAAARKYFWLAFLANPFYPPSYPHLIPSIGGRWTYERAAIVRRKLAKVRSSLGSLIN